MDILKQDIYDFTQNPCWIAIRNDLIAQKESKYALATTEETRVPQVKSCMDKIQVIDSILEMENDFIKEYNNPQGEK